MSRRSVIKIEMNESVDLHRAAAFVYRQIYVEEHIIQVILDNSFINSWYL